MTTLIPTAPSPLHNSAGLRFECWPHGAPGRCFGHGVMVNQHPASLFEAGGTQLWLRLHDGAGRVQAVPLLGPLSPLQAGQGSDTQWTAQGSWQGLTLKLMCILAQQATVWFWHLAVVNGTGQVQQLDLVFVQDVALARYGALRLNEYYVSHYIDLTPLQHPQHGCLVAARQNLAVDGRHPWLLVGALQRAVAFATDALQVLGLGVRGGGLPVGIKHGLPSRRLQHEHAVIAVQDQGQLLAPGAGATLGFFAQLLADHAAATSAADQAHADAALALPEARSPWPASALAAQAVAVQPSSIDQQPLTTAPPQSLFSQAPLLPTLDLTEAELQQHFAGPRRHEEFDGPSLLSFYCGLHTHVVLRAKELRTMRPHGHVLRSGQHLVPDETALTSTVWMGGVFHSMLTQGHVGINRCLSTVRGWLGAYRSHGQRVFVDLGLGWQQLALPSAFEMQPQACRWLYRHAAGLIELRSRAHGKPHSMSLKLRVLQGAPVRVLVTHHVALGGDDGIDGAAVVHRPLAVGNGAGLWVAVPPTGDLAARFPDGGFLIQPEAGVQFERAGGDELLHVDGQPHGQPWVCVQSAATTRFGLRLRVRLLQAPVPAQAQAHLPQWQLPAGSPLLPAMQRLTDIAPWYLHNALVHYLSPRGLEQFSGGGWGTRDVCQGPLEMLLALDRPAPVRDLLLRVFAAQDAGGDWPQWFMFFQREQHLRASDAHGDIVFWPLLGLARYLLASGDAAVLDERVDFYAPSGTVAQAATVWQHVERALQVIQARRIAGTALAAYGHGDWNDSLQPANPALREHLCSAWTVTLHHLMLTTLARALHGLGMADRAAPLHAEGAAVAHDFQRLLVVDGVVAGYALFEPPGAAQPPPLPQLLLHPQDRLTGVSYSLLPMMHAILGDLLSPAQAQAQRQLIDQHLTGADGARLFDRPMPYRGGPEILFQRAESSAFFGREVGAMYMHAHLRWAETLAHLGAAEALFAALARANPIALREWVPSARWRQANCYFSSSDAAFADRYEASAQYDRVRTGAVPLDGGWRVYSSGPGIALALIVGHFLGVRREHDRLVLDPVIPPALDGLRVRLLLHGLPLNIEYRLGVKGCGPQRLTLNGQHLPYTRAHNPYRLGAAEISMMELRARMPVPSVPSPASEHQLTVHTD